MNNLINKKLFLSILMLHIFLNGIIYGQSTIDKLEPPADSLSLKSVIQQVISTYPSVKIAEEAIRNADSRIGLAKTG